MAKQVKNVDTKAVAPETKAATVVLYTLGKAPRNGLNAVTKHGEGGTAGTYAKLKDALKDGPLEMAAIQKLCKDNGDSGFARYAVRNHWLMVAAETK